ncbi:MULTISPECIES: hypothetical protein [unclassified Pseudomonas]|uniref:hypothetical protein n=1 Tax=unclassified Pseudomonas TaxID=196821 RepID=UPI0024483AAA|nr:MULTISPECIES: hypothetical protein [unclassified Pseudomonas]MDG9922421.1 hypothetical protein [Pseudomonas sp. GD04045]MDH0034381.1 hypothetical protein [Pseudomonas sp. GD04019]
MSLTASLAERCHPQVADQYGTELARYARLDTACDAFNAFAGCRPAEDSDVFDTLSQRRREIAEVLAQANLSAYEREVSPGLYLAIPYFDWCSDKQPIWLVNRTDAPCTYLRRSSYAFASTDDGVDEYRTAGSAFDDGIASGSVIQPGQKHQIDTYSMSFDGDFISARRVALIIDGERDEYFVSISKLAGFLTCQHLHGLHKLNRVTGT